MNKYIVNLLILFFITFTAHAAYLSDWDLEDVYFQADEAELVEQDFYDQLVGEHNYYTYVDYNERLPFEVSAPDNPSEPGSVRRAPPDPVEPGDLPAGNPLWGLMFFASMYAIYIIKK